MKGRSKIISSTTLISFGLSCLALALVLGAWSAGLVPDAGPVVARARAQAAQATAARCGAALTTLTADVAGAARPPQPQAAAAEITRLLAEAAATDAELWSAQVRGADGLALAEHLAGPAGTSAQPPTGAQLAEAAVYRGSERWGTLAMTYRPAGAITTTGLLPVTHVGLRLALAVGAAAFVLFGVYLRYTLRHLDPAAVIPPRVRAMLDTLAEGVLVIDSKGIIVLANHMFAQAAGCEADDLIGRPAGGFGWTDPADPQTRVSADALPWIDALAGRGAVKGRALLLRPQSAGGEPRLLAVNASPITGSDGRQRGALVTFDDQTQMERLNAVLSTTNNNLARANSELARLATTDPMTGCLNRRAFMDAFTEQWESHRTSGKPLACVMIDVDKFKSINDRFGHAAGDRVLIDVAKLLLSFADASAHHLVCRYGGEEFCLLLPGHDLDAAAAVAERVRQVIESARWPITPVTTSLGVSSTVFKAPTTGPAAVAADGKTLQDQADQALYAAKRTGRNRVCRWDALPHVAPEELADRSSPAASSPPPARDDAARQAELLTTMLSRRHDGTAAHCRRVAALCRTAAEGLLPPQAARLLERAALLHDIGKIGVPDAVLLKPGPLTDAEWAIMRRHDQIGVDILRAAGVDDEVIAIVAAHHHKASPPAGAPHATSDHVPSPDLLVAARLLAIADAYDAMTSDRVYRRAMPPPAAVAELRRCAGTEFDADLVEHFVRRLATTAPATPRPVRAAA